MYVEESGTFPVLMNSRMSGWIVCRAGMALGGRRRVPLVEIPGSTSWSTSRSCSSAFLAPINLVTPNRSIRSLDAGTLFISELSCEPEVVQYISSNGCDSG